MKQKGKLGPWVVMRDPRDGQWWAWYAARGGDLKRGPFRTLHDAIEYCETTNVDVDLNCSCPGVPR